MLFGKMKCCTRSRLLFVFVSIMALLACGPKKRVVIADFEQIVALEISAGLRVHVDAIGPGEGDSDNSYQHVEFHVIVEHDAIIVDGWLAGIVTRQGQILSNGEAVLLYQKTADKWLMVGYYLAKKPT